MSLLIRKVNDRYPSLDFYKVVMAAESMGLLCVERLLTPEFEDEDCVASLLVSGCSLLCCCGGTKVC